MRPGHRQQAIGNRPDLAHAHCLEPPAYVLCLDSVDQTDRSAAQPVCLTWNRRISFQDPQLDGQMNLTIKLTSRADCDSQETGELISRASTGALSDVGADRDHGRSHLRGEPISLLSWEPPGQLVDRLTQGNAFPPHVEPPKVAHPCLDNPRRGSYEPPRPIGPLWPVAYGLGLMAWPTQAWIGP